MFRKIEKQDKDFYINAVKDFYTSDAVVHNIPESYIEKTFEKIKDKDEILRLKQITGLAALFKDVKFGKAWVPVEEDDRF